MDQLVDPAHLVLSAFLARWERVEFWGIQGDGVLLVLTGLPDLQEDRDSQEVQGSPANQATEDLRVTRENRGLPDPRSTLMHKGCLFKEHQVTTASTASLANQGTRELQGFQDNQDDQATPSAMVAEAAQGSLVHRGLRERGVTQADRAMVLRANQEDKAYQEPLDHPDHQADL